MLKAEGTFKNKPNYEQLISWMVICDLPHKIYYLTRQKDWKTEYENIRDSFIHQYEIMFPLYNLTEADVDVVCLAFVCVIGLISQEEYNQTITSLMTTIEGNDGARVDNEKDEGQDSEESCGDMLDIDENIDQEDDFEDVDNDLYSITRQFHEKKQIDIYVVRTTEKPTKYTFAELRMVAKSYGDGYYSSFTGVKGYVFYTPEDAQDFVNDILDLNEVIEENEETYDVEDSSDEEEEYIETNDYTITKQYNENKGVDIFVVRLTKRVGEETFSEYREIARSHGKGYYSTYRGVNGFVFYTTEDARAFVSELFDDDEENQEVKNVNSRNGDSHSFSIEIQDFSIDITEEKTLTQIVRKIVEQFGKDIIKEKKFIYILADFKVFTSNPALKRILKVLIEDGYTEQWMSSESLKQGETFVLKEASTISQLYGFKESLLKNVITDILSPLGLITDKNDAEDVQYMAEPNLSTMGYGDLEDYYKECFKYRFEENKADEYLKDKQGILYGNNKEALVLGNFFDGSSYYVRYGTKFIADSAWKWNHNEKKKQPLTLHLPDTLIALGESAFENVKFTHLEVPSSVKLLLKRSFSGCKFDKLILNEGIEYIDEGAFQFTNLTSVELPSTTKYVGANAFPLGIKLTCKSNFLYVDWRFICDKERKTLFCNYSDNKRFIFPDSIEVIYDEVFSFCMDLETVVLSKSLRVIGDSAFSYCVKLQNIKLPDSLESIGENAFENCTSLYFIVIPPKVKHIGEGVFRGCNNLSNVISLSPFYEVEDEALYDVKKKTLLFYFGIDKTYKVRKGTKTIGKDAFYSSPNLQSVELPSSVMEIKMWAFRDCPNLRAVIMSNNKCNIGYGAFSGCPCEKSQISTNLV